jgi:hypothetical protein
MSKNKSTGISIPLQLACSPSVSDLRSPSEKQQLSGRAFLHLPNHQKQMAQMMRFI